MEYIIDLVPFLIVLIIFILIALRYNKKQNFDGNVEWIGEDVVLKKKEYPTMKDNFGEETRCTAEKDKEIKRQDNILNKKTIKG